MKKQLPTKDEMRNLIANSNERVFVKSKYFMNGMCEVNAFGYYHYGEMECGVPSGYGFFSYRKNSQNYIIDPKGRKSQQWHRGNFKGFDMREGFGEFRTPNSWYFGNWNNNKFESGHSQQYDEGRKTYFNHTYKYGSIESSNKGSIPKIIPHQVRTHAKSAIRVVCNGYWFRSKLEFKWAKFFHFMDIDWIYEPAKFTLSNGQRYTPDFYLPAQRIWIEIKPETDPIEEERKKAQLLKYHLVKNFDRKAKVFLIYGDCRPPYLQKYRSGAKVIEFKTKQKPIEPCIIIEHWKGIKIVHRNFLDNINPSENIKNAYEFANRK